MTTRTRANEAPDQSASTRQFPVFGNARGLERLSFTAYEAEQIARLADSGSVFMATGAEASRNTILQTRLAEFRVVHIATHGLIDSRYPALSALAFSQFDQDGNEQYGMLRLSDVYGLFLNADLVTMSACRTALGRQVSGEGLTGLTQGLMYSGARAVLASLWQVPDRATAELMTRFYHNLFKEGQSAPAALRAAQLDLSSQARWRHPYFWSAFILQGDWRKAHPE